jgi:signal transduction histidine kinase
LYAVIRSAAVDAALGGGAGTAAVDVRQGAEFVAAVPVFRPGGAHTAGNALGAFVVGVRVKRSDLADVARSAGDQVAASLVSPNATIVATDHSFVSHSLLANRSFAEGETKLGGTTYLVSMVRLSFSEPPTVALALSLPVSAAVDVSTAFPRALVGGVLVAALLAVVIALWLASRITRPILSLADEAERVKSDFLATVSHELRTPLTPIRGYADLLRRGRVPRRRAEVYLDEIDEAARRLERIVSLLVEVAAMEAGRFSPNTQAVVPAELLEQAAARWRGRSRLHKLVVQVPKSLPRVAADLVSIARVLDELIDNAFKFSPEGGTVELRARRAGDAVEFAVADEGIGIDSEALDRLSQAFVQADPGKTRRFGGLGLGLTFANGVLAAHDGRVSVRATKDGGATFTFELPTIGMVSRMPDRAETWT